MIININDSELDFTHLIIQMLHFIKIAFEVGGRDSSFLKNMFWWKERKNRRKRGNEINKLGLLKLPFICVSLCFSYNCEDNGM